MAEFATAPSVDFFIERWHPAKVNQLLSGHWSKGHRLKKRDREMVWAYAQGTPKASAKRRLELTIVLQKGQRGGDVDAYHKSTLDALKHAGLILDDNRQGVELLPILYERGPGWGTRIRLWDL